MPPDEITMTVIKKHWLSLSVLKKSNKNSDNLTKIFLLTHPILIRAVEIVCMMCRNSLGKTSCIFDREFVSCFTND